MSNFQILGENGQISGTASNWWQCGECDNWPEHPLGPQCSDYGHLENIIFIKSSYLTINERWSLCRIMGSASVSECQQYDIKTVHCFLDTNVYSELIILHCTISEKVVVNKLLSRFIFSMGYAGLGGHK